MHRVITDVCVAKQKMVSGEKVLKQSVQKKICIYSSEIFHKYIDKMGQSMDTGIKDREEAELRRCLSR